ncbi:uncharacterized protein LOC134227465 [Armigeres subalbatus]|uniref:uncharacterized protein LOC134227465 n=1 Tax=Armigeres subalbatus TaxID=124917 RepID=UPI002ED35047
MTTIMTIQVQLGSAVTMAHRSQLRIAKDSETNDRPNVTISTRRQMQTITRQRPGIENGSNGSGERDGQEFEEMVVDSGASPLPVRRNRKRKQVASDRSDLNLRRSKRLRKSTRQEEFWYPRPLDKDK